MSTRGPDGPAPGPGGSGRDAARSGGFGSGEFSGASAPGADEDSVTGAASGGGRHLRAVPDPVEQHDPEGFDVASRVAHRLSGLLPPARLGRAAGTAGVVARPASSARARAPTPAIRSRSARPSTSSSRPGAGAGRSGCGSSSSAGTSSSAPPTPGTRRPRATTTASSSSAPSRAPGPAPCARSPRSSSRSSTVASATGPSPSSTSGARAPPAGATAPARCRGAGPGTPTGSARPRPVGSVRHSTVPRSRRRAARRLPVPVPTSRSRRHPGHVRGANAEVRWERRHGGGIRRGERYGACGPCRGPGRGPGLSGRRAWSESGIGTVRRRRGPGPGERDDGCRAGSRHDAGSPT